MRKQTSNLTKLTHPTSRNKQAPLPFRHPTARNHRPITSFPPHKNLNSTANTHGTTTPGAAAPDELAELADELPDALRVSVRVAVSVVPLRLVVSVVVDLSSLPDLDELLLLVELLSARLATICVCAGPGAVMPPYVGSEMRRHPLGSAAVLVS